MGLEAALSPKCFAAMWAAVTSGEAADSPCGGTHTDISYIGASESSLRLNPWRALRTQGAGPSPVISDSVPLGLDRRTSLLTRLEVASHLEKHNSPLGPIVNF